MMKLVESELVLAQEFEDAGISWQRLYRIELLRKTRDPAACASSASPARGSPSDAVAQRFSSQAAPKPLFLASEQPGNAGYLRLAMFQDVWNRSIEDIQEEILLAIDDEPGEYRLEILYWEGNMRHPDSDGIKRFHYDHNPRGDIVAKADPIYFTIEDED